MGPDSSAVSRQWADAAFADPTLRESFERAVAATEARRPIPDDFAWLASDVRPTEYSRFEELARRLLSVPKHAIERVRHTKPA